MLGGYIAKRYPDAWGLYIDELKDMSATPDEKRNLVRISHHLFCEFLKKHLLILILKSAIIFASERFFMPVLLS